MIVLPNKEEVLGFGYTNYSEAYSVDDDGFIYYGAGFVALPRQCAITEDDISKGLELIQTSKDSQQENKSCSYVLSYTQSFGPCHYVVNNKYVVYSVEDYICKI